MIKTIIIIMIIIIIIFIIIYVYKVSPAVLLGVQTGWKNQMLWNKTDAKIELQ